MAQNPNTYEQFCKHKNKNVLFEERFDKDGTHSILCKHKVDCDAEDCVCIERLRKSIQNAKNYKSFQK